MSNETNIAIIGMDGRFPGANTLNEFWDNLAEGRSTISDIPLKRWNWKTNDSENKDQIYSRRGGFIDGVDEFDPLFFNISPIEAKSIDPQERLFLETCWNVFEDAGYSMERIRNELASTGVFVGAMYSDYGLRGGGYHHWSIANRVSFFFDLNGPSMAVDSACSSSLLALHLACESIRRRECQQAIAGGVSLILHKKHYQDLCKMQMLSASGQCSAFGEKADGFVDGEGVGAVLLKPYQQALDDGDRIYGIIAGSAVNSGGRTNGYTVPNPTQQANAIAKCLSSAKIPPAEISYIEAHGTGTSLGDPIEISALINAIDQNGEGEKQQDCAIGTVKPNIGHLEAAAGIAGLIKTLLQLKHRQIVPSLNCEKENPRYNLSDTPFYINKVLTPWTVNTASNPSKRRCAGISSFGAGGTNVHLVLAEDSKGQPDNRTADKDTSSPCMITLSGKRLDDLTRNLERLYNFLQQDNPPRLDDLSYSLHVAKTDYEHRMVFMSHSLSELVSDIRNVLDTGISANCFRSDNEQERNSRLQVLVQQKGGEEYLYSLWNSGCADNNSMQILGKLWLAGIDINWRSLYIRQQLDNLKIGSKPILPRVISLPRYAFDKKSYWLEDNSLRTNEAVSDGSLNQDSVGQAFFFLSDGSKEVTETYLALKNEPGRNRLFRLSSPKDLKTSLLNHNMSDASTINILVPESYLSLLLGSESRCSIDEGANRDLSDLIDLALRLDQSKNYNFHFVLQPDSDKSVINTLGTVISSSRKNCTVSVAEPLLVQKQMIAREGIGAILSKDVKHDTNKKCTILTGPHSECFEIFDGNVALITIGDDKACFDVVYDIAQNTAQLVIIGGMKKSEINDEIEKLEAIAPNAIYLESRADKASYRKAVNYSLQRFGKLNVVAHCSVEQNKKDNNLADNIIATMLLDIASEKIPLSHFLHIIVSNEKGTNSAGTLFEAFCCERNRMTAQQNRSGKAIVVNWTVGAFEVKQDTSRSPEHKPPSDKEVDDSQIKDILVSILSSVLEIDVAELSTKYMDTSFFEIGIDSIFSARICEQISKYTVEKVSPVILYNYNNLQLLAKYLKGKWSADTPGIEHNVPIVQQHKESLDLSVAIKSADESGSETLFYRPQWNNFKVRPVIEAINSTLVLIGAKPDFVQQLKSETGENAVLVHEHWSDALTAKVLHSETISKPIHFVYFADADLRLKEEGFNQIHNIFSMFKTLFEKADSYRKIMVTYVGVAPNRISNSEMNSSSHEAVMSFGRSLAKEFSQLKFDYISFTNDVGSPRCNQALIELIHSIQHTSCNEDDPCVGEKWNKSEYYRLVGTNTEIRRWEQTASLENELKESGESHRVLANLAENSSYLVSGGSTGIGLLFASYLAQNSAGSNIYICSRSELGTKSKQMVEQVNADQKLNHKGSKIVHICADVSREEDISRVFSRVVLDGKPLKGIIHNAGITRDSMFLKKSWQDMSAVLSVKMHGVHWLDEYSTGHALDFFVMSSSISSVIGNAGQSDYAFANGYLDGFSRYRQFLVENGERKGQTISINWPLWCNKSLINGMEVPTNYRMHLEEEYGLQLLPKEAGLLVLQNLLQKPYSQIMTLHGVSSRLKEKVIEPLNAEYCATQPNGEGKAVEDEKVFNAPSAVSEKNNLASMDIAIVGVSGRFPDAETPDEMFENCLKKHSSVRELPEKRFSLADIYDKKPYQLGKTVCKYAGLLENIDHFDAKFFGIMPMEANYIDPQQRLFLQSAWHAFEDAGYTKADLNGKNCGVYVGCMTSDYQKIIEQQTPPNAFAMLGTHAAVLPARLSYWLNLKGPAVAFDTACSSSLVALHQACNSIRLGETKMALVSSVYLVVNERDLTTASQAGMLSKTDGCKTFDQSADGIAIGEAVTAIVLKPLQEAERDGDQIYGVIKGSGTNQDGYTSGMTAPNSLSQAALINDVYHRFGIEHDSVDYIETHGTGTKLGDPIECEALATVFGGEAEHREYTKPCYLGALKPNIGHSFNAAGMSSLIKVLMAFKYKTIPPVTKVSKVNDLINIANSRLVLPQEPVTWTESIGKPMRAGVTALGYTGTNAHVILDAYSRVERPSKITEFVPRYQCVVISESTPQRLAKLIEELVKLESRWQQHDMYPEIKDIAYTSQHCRIHHKYRAVIIACSKPTFSNALKRLKMISPKQLADGVSESAEYVENNIENRLEQWGVVTGCVNKDEQLIFNNISNEKEHLFYDKMTLAKCWCIDGVHVKDILSTSDILEQVNAIKVSLPLRSFETQSFWISADNNANKAEGLKKQGTLYPENKLVKENKLRPLKLEEIKRPNHEERKKLSVYIKGLDTLSI
ncbi:KR domain-containing protein [Photobacterium gaetbulicola]|uniref:Uncharacterized protein n=1 Tax=Photobacterium gaetbulicola Gung47 TaxID=658445 RepID=A0A0C5WRT7_9GAMM|nr:SDR family NAD(P)-dependent oxidoreductase [Photobacterium gaetbulicola]AJR05680.1 hypothetical protein H744_1c0655 [Photobacterium gaetbulicola Gung47]PSU14654.1 KR domain-containing protein [Photobacterium gaetbulicola]